jgi:hypothetical protein
MLKKLHMELDRSMAISALLLRELGLRIAAND